MNILLLLNFITKRCQIATFANLNRNLPEIFFETTRKWPQWPGVDVRRERQRARHRSPLCPAGPPTPAAPNGQGNTF